MKGDPSPVTIRTSTYRLDAAPDRLAALEQAGLTRAEGFDAMLREARVLPGGRGPQRRVALPGLAEPIRLREARRGGALATLLPSRFLSPRRGSRELALWLALRTRGAPLPEPVAAFARRRGLGWALHFASLDRRASRDGLAWLATSPSRAERLAAAAALGAALRRFHDAGALHGDLNLRNVLIEPGAAGPSCLLIDLASARRAPHATPRERLRDLLRLERSLEKNGFGGLLDRRLRARTLAAYCAGDRRLRTALLAAHAGEARSLSRHRLAWRLERAFGRRGAAALVGLGLVALVAIGCGEGDRRAEGHDAARADATGPAWSILAVGDTGRAGRRVDSFEGQLAVAAAMTNEARERPVSGLVFLGDNFYDRGLREAELVERIRLNLVRPYCHFLALSGPRSAEVEADCPVPAAERRPVPVFAVLGNHDLESPESARLQREAIPAFLPDWQMSAGLTRVIEVHPGVSLILFESEPAIDDRATIERELSAAIRAARGPWRILATHRPIATDDLGGVPKGGYPDYVRDGIERSGRPVQLVLCGHHHSLQAFALGPPTPLLQIGAGSGSRAEPPVATGHPDLRHATLALGFARVALRGEAPDDRLEVSLVRVPSWPVLTGAADHSTVARFAVDRSGRVESLAPGAAESRPAP